MGAKKDFQKFGKTLGRSLKNDVKIVARGTLSQAPKVGSLLGGALGTVAGATLGGVGAPVGGALGVGIGNELGRDAQRQAKGVKFLR